jgi:hypothetical protein
MTVRAKHNLEENESELCLGMILGDQLLFSLFFQRNDLSMEPTIDQKIMINDDSQYVLLCTSRNVAKTVSLIGRTTRDIVTYLPQEGTRNDEILVFTPSESHLTPLVGRIFDFLGKNPLFRTQIKTWNRTTDKPLLETKNGLKMHFRIEGAGGSDTNMVGLHPYKIYGDEMAFGNSVCHTSRMAGAQPNCKVVYSGVPNGVRNTPFYQLDKTKYGDDWSRHKFSMLTSNPLFLKSKKYRQKISAMFGGKHSPQYITQVKGEWGDEATSSFPPGSVSFDIHLYGRKVHPYYDVRLSGIEVNTAAKEGRLPILLKIPSVTCLRAAIGWDYGFSPDPTNIIVGIQTEENGPWKTYCRVSLYNTPMHRQIDILKLIWANVLNGKCMMLSTDNQIGFQELQKDDNRHFFEGHIKLSNPGGNIEIDTVTGMIVTERNEKDADVLAHKADGKLVKEGRKYWLTELLRRYMMSAILKNPNEIRLELGYDGEMESEFIGTVERKTKNHTVYEVPRNSNKVFLDQITDALRYLVDSISEIEEKRNPEQALDYSQMLSELGWTGKSTGWRQPWQ